MTKETRDKLFMAIKDNPDISSQEKVRLWDALDNPAEKDNQRLARDFYNGCAEIFHRMCAIRCPENHGYEKKCERCLVQHIFTICTSHFKVWCGDKKDDFQAFDALVKLVVEEHKPEHFCW